MCIDWSNVNYLVWRRVCGHNLEKDRTRAAKSVFPVQASILPCGLQFGKEKSSGRGFEPRSDGCLARAMAARPSRHGLGIICWNGIQVARRGFRIAAGLSGFEFVFIWSISNDESIGRLEIARNLDKKSVRARVAASRARVSVSRGAGFS